MSEICKNLNHRPSIEKVFYIAILTTCLLGFYLICFGVFEAVYSVVVSVLTFINLLLILYTNTKSKWYYKEIATYLYFLVSISHLPVFFFGSARINFSRRKRDELLVSIDDFLLGWLWEKGQLSLTLDSSPNYNPDTKFHKIFGSILQVFYFMYYIYPYGCIYFIPLAKCIIESIKKYKNKGMECKNYKKIWNDLYFITSVYTFSYVACNVMNTMLPAVSPRLYFEYKHQLVLSGIAQLLNDTCKDNKSANSFPSGHVSETMCIAFALFGMGRWIFGTIVLIGCILILMATLVLRYHYIIDVIAALVMSSIAFLIPYIFYKKAKEDNDKFDLIIEKFLTNEEDKEKGNSSGSETLSELSFHIPKDTDDDI